MELKLEAKSDYVPLEEEAKYRMSNMGAFVEVGFDPTDNTVSLNIEEMWFDADDLEELGQLLCKMAKHVRLNPKF